MGSYLRDRAFTDQVHKQIALPIIYEQLKWQKVTLDAAKASHIDMHKGIDYVFKYEGKYMTVQERFRERKYHNYSDLTIRYRRDGNKYADRHESEYYKMKAAYFTYGITNCDKSEVNKCSDFLKFAVIDLQKVYEKIDSGDIFIADNKRHRCILAGNKIECPIKYNSDFSSSFFSIEISYLAALWGNEIIIAQKGFL